MLIQVSHSRHYDFQEDLYNPIKGALFFSEYSWIFPHDGREVDSKVTLRNVDLLIAEVSSPTTGNTLEIGMASAYGKRILCIYKKGSMISSSLKFVTEDFIEYDSPEDMVGKIGTFLKKS